MDFFRWNIPSCSLHVEGQEPSHITCKILLLPWVSYHAVYEPHFVAKEDTSNERKIQVLCNTEGTFY